MMTGQPWGVFRALHVYLCSFLPKNSVTKDSLPTADQLFITLFKLHYDVSFDILAILKGIKNALTSSGGGLIVYITIPPVFKAYFPRLTLLTLVILTVWSCS